MGIKSTVRLTRTDAENRYIEHRLIAVREELRREVQQIADVHLEDVLEAQSDERAREQNSFVTSGFDNFLIISDEEQLTRYD